MKQAEMITISKTEYITLKKKAEEAEVDEKLVQSFIRGLEDIKSSRATQWKPKAN